MSAVDEAREALLATLSGGRDAPIDDAIDDFEAAILIASHDEAWAALRMWLREQSAAADRAATFPGEVFPQWHQGARHMADGTLTQMGELDAAIRASEPAPQREAAVSAVDEAREALFDAVRGYGDAIRDVALDKATFVLIDHAWGVLHTREVALIAAVRAECAGEGLEVAARAYLAHVAEAASWPTPGIGCDAQCKEADALRAALGEKQP